MEDPDFSFWACTQAIADGPDDGASCRENPAAADDFGYIVLNDKANNECYILKEGENTIGRHPLNNIYIEHPSVSMNHAVIQCDSDGVVLLDKGSLNKTRLNKKILKKNVAYFLDENALLIFGEVQANYYVDTVPSETTNQKASDDTLVQKATVNDGFSIPKLSDTIILPNTSCTRDTSNTITSADVSLVTENSSTCKTKTTILNCIADSDKTKNNLNDVHSDLNSPSSSDEFLLDAISQIECNEINENSSEFLLTNKIASSPNMNVTEHHMLKINSNVLSVSDMQRLCTEVMPESTREDTPSPVMDLGPLIDYDDRLSVQETNYHNTLNIDTSSPDIDLTDSIPTQHIFRIDNNIPSVSDMQALCTEVMPDTTREDTPSPVMDLGSLIDYDDRFSAQETNNHNILSSCGSKGSEFDETQSMDIDNNISKNSTQILPSNNLSNLNTSPHVSKSLSGPNTLNYINESNMLDECTQLPVMDNEDLLSVDKSDSVTKRDELNNSDNLTSLLKKPSTSKKENITKQNQNIFDEDDDIFISVGQKVESFETQIKNFLQINKADKLSNSISPKSNNNFLNKSEKNEIVDDFCEHPIKSPSTSTYFHSKTETVVCKKNACKQNHNTFEADDDDIFNDFIEKEFNSQSHTSTGIIDKDLSNCPVQRVSLYSNKQETQDLPEFPSQCEKTNFDTSNTGSTSKSNDLNQVSDLEEDDFFNCPTQKISINKKISELKKLSQSVNELETQLLPDLPSPRKTYGDSSNSKNKNSNFQLDDDDFFNCPTQKVSISKKINEIKKPSQSINELETQPLPDFSSQCRKINFGTSNTGSTSKSNDLNQVSDSGEDDFFNCPTQKISINKKISEMKKLSQSINELETQPLPDLPPLKNTNVDSSNSKNKDSNFQLDDGDFFNCPTQKVSISKKINEMNKPSLSIHELETQPLSDLSPQRIKTYLDTPYTDSTSKNKDVNQVAKKDNEDIFNCSTQKLSISKKMNEMKQPPQSIHEQETEPLPDFPLQLSKAYPSTSISGSTSKNKDLNFELDDDDFFNCPTQKLSISKKINEMKKLSLSIHEQETQPLPDFPLKPSKAYPSTSISGSTSKNKDSDLQMDDDDFFNCPTQKVSISKKINEMKKPSLSIHELETQPLPDLTYPRKTYPSLSNTNSTGKSKDLDPEMDDGDFFNCPTQKVSINKKISEMKKLSQSIHEQETQPLPNLSPQRIKEYVGTSSSSKNKDVNQVAEKDGEDFFNCPTQKLSIYKQINEMKKLSLSIHEQETQPIPNLPTGSIKTYIGMSNTNSTGKSKDLNPEMDEEDFFNFPTQKLSFSKQMNEMKKLSLSINEQETQPIPDLPTETIKTYIGMSNSTSSSESKDLNPEMDKEDFFNCPTQKLSMPKKMNEMKKLSLSISKQNTIPQPAFSPQSRKTNMDESNSSSTNKSKDTNPEMDNDFFNRPTQPLPDNSPPSNTHKRYYKNRVTSRHNSSTLVSEIDEDFFNRLTQPLPDDSQPDITIFNSRATITNKNSTRVSLVDENGFNYTNQKLLPHEISSTGNNKQNVLNTNETETQELTPAAISTVSLTKINGPDEKKQNKENICNCRTQNVSTKIQLNTIKDEIEEHVFDNDGIPYGTKSNFISGKSKRLCSNDVSDGHELLNQKQSVVSDPKSMHMIRKSTRIQSISNNKPSAQLPVNLNQNQNALKNSKTIKKPIIYVRKDLHKSGSGDFANNSSSINKPHQKAGENNIETSTSNNSVQPSSKITPEEDSDLIILSSIKKFLADESKQQQVGDSYSLRRRDQLKPANETIFSPSNEPSTSSNPSLEQHQNPLAIQSNIDLPNCQPSTSNDSSSQWKSFWNQKKMSCHNKGKSGSQKNTVNTSDIVKKERYQTRANTKRDNSIELNRKRKQDNVNDEKVNKRMCKDDTEDTFRPPVQETLDIVVTFSYLKSRNLVEMKQFVELTGGYVTEEITESTVLVTDKVRCSMKVLSAIARGCPIVDANWVKHSYTVKMFQDINDFIITDKDAERKHKFKLKESLAKAKAKGLLDGYTVMVTPSVKPSPKDMKVIITCAGGNYVINWPKKRHPKELIVTCEQDRRRWKPLWDNNKAKLIDNDAFIMSIMRQKLSV